MTVLTICGSSLFHNDTDCQPCRWKKKDCSLSKIVWDFPFDEKVPHVSGLSGYIT